MADNTKYLESSWSERSIMAKEKALKAVAQLKAQKEPVNFSSVHKSSGVSKHFLYENEEVKAVIEAERSQEEAGKTAWHSKYDKTSKSKDVIIKTKEKYIIKLETENAKLRKEINHLRSMIYEKK
ncbi:MAG: transposase [Clostridiales bacterium]|nr:transposase [Clostridiales bacterium]